MTQWGTILIYFRMPDWVKDLDESLVEKKEDPDNIKAFKVRKNVVLQEGWRERWIEVCPQILVAPLTNFLFCIYVLFLCTEISKWR
jgi:hypothetical protein